MTYTYSQTLEHIHSWSLNILLNIEKVMSIGLKLILSDVYFLLKIRNRFSKPRERSAATEKNTTCSISISMEGALNIKLSTKWHRLSTALHTEDTNIESSGKTIPSCEKWSVCSPSLFFYPGS